MQHTKTDTIISEGALSAHTLPLATTQEKAWRVSAMDIQRGIIMLLMAFAHCREYVSPEHYSNYFFSKPPTWEGTSTFDLLQQIFVSLLASGGFFMMMGIGVVFLYQSRLKEGWSLENTCLYLIKRGSLLILLQFTLMQFFELLSAETPYLYIGVLFALGVNMIFASICIYSMHKLKAKFALKTSALEYCLPLALVMIITLSVQLLINYLHDSHTTSGFWLIALILGGRYHYGIDIDLDFTPIPWFPAVAVGLMIGQLLYSQREKSFRLLFGIALSFLVTWFFIRTGNLSGWSTFGDYKLLAPGDLASPASYFAVSKYPPSIAYFLWAFGVNLLCICIWQLAEKHTPAILNFIKPVKIFGQCALFFFIMHWFVYFGISQCLPTLVTAPLDIAKLWILGLIPLYFMCKRYYAFKSRKPASSIWRMF